MFVHTLEFTSAGQLARAYEEIAVDGSVEDCSIELDALRIRFLATPALAQHLVERIYLAGGLRFASRHPAISAVGEPAA